MKKLFSIILIFLSLSTVKAMDIVSFNECIDGDTASFILDSEIIKVRFLAIDTPETVHPNKEVDPVGELASDYTCDRIKNASIIKLEYDDNSELYDKYKRVLAWIWVDDVLLQEELISLGYAKVEYIYGDYKYLNNLYSLEKSAKESNLGLWNTIYSVEFEIDKKIITKKVLKNTSVKYFEPIKEGYKFIRWEHNNQEFDFNTKINEDIKLKAVFEKEFNYYYIITIVFLIILYFTNRKLFKKKLKKILKANSL
ncbi:MAG: thermonuclease family protein [Bacilli bacterium]|nr:thermonuclease family protein [Bacilli bacterium]MDD4733534.1 thermonuclease family protein [Bacilli bacterium]